MNENENGKPARPAPPPFEHGMSQLQIILGSVWLAVHILVLPILAGVWSQVSPEPVSEAKLNLAVYVISTLALMILMFRWWREQFCRFLDRPGRCIGSMLLGGAADYAMSMVVGGILMLLLGADFVNPNNEMTAQIALEDPGIIRATAIFLAPLVEETLFRGVLFGSVRRKHRTLAFVLSTLLFCLLHVWQYVVADQDLSLLIYGIQYIPASLALAWCYERSGSLWSSVFLHMLINALAFTMLGI